MGFLALMYVGVSCSESPMTEAENSVEHSAARAFGTLRACASMDVLAQQLADNPNLKAQMDEVEVHTNRIIASKVGTSALGPNDIITIPVVVNVLWNTTQENISDAQIQSQIDVLNEDYSNTNTDLTKTPTAFKPLIGKMNVKFVLSAVYRKQTTKTSWGTNDDIKKTNKGGLNPTDPTKKLNMWVGNIGGGILGYAQFPGGKAATDGVVIGPNYFGRTGYVSAPFDKGRTASHEVGHWLNLRHIWGDDGTKCTGSDLVSDTPNAAGPNYGCPSFPKLSCSNGPNGDLWMNFMDYTDDACMYMFTAGQVTRSRAIFATGGPRASFVQ